MTNQELELLKFPIGKFIKPDEITPFHIAKWISVLQEFPNQLEALVANLTNTDLEKTYRPNGWTIRQIVHHVADSHHHSYIRFKWAITENEPVIKAYNEADWADLHDYNLPIDLSLMHVKVIHAKLVAFVKGISKEDFNRCFIHPETNSKVYLNENLGIYAWHSLHHLEHIKIALTTK